MHVVVRGSGTPLVLLHGFRVDHRLLLPLDPALDAAGGWQRLYLDLPGHGGTPIGAAASADDIADAVADELRDRLGDRPFAILGSSFGGMIARRIAHDHRDRVLGLAVLAGVFTAEHAARDVPARTVLHSDPAATAGMEHAADDYRELAVVESPANARAFLESAYPGLRAADPVGLALIEQQYALRREPEDAAQFTQPSLFVTARQDHVVGYSGAWAQLEHYPRATFATLDGAGHNVHLDQPALTAALVTDWLTRMASGSAHR